jgi:mono/diheme cytochrome c family protein
MSRAFPFRPVCVAATLIVAGHLGAGDGGLSPPIIVAAQAGPISNDRGAGPAEGRPPVLLAQKAAAKKKGAARKEAAKVDEAAREPASTPTPAAPSANDAGIKFSRDIAPILVGNCTGCHNPERRRGKFDLTTFEKLMAGSDKEKVIVPGKPDESHLVLRIKGEETSKMPQGNNNNLSDEAIARVEKWVLAGARLDAGIDPKATLNSYAPTPEQLRAAELKKLPAEERDRRVEAAARKRWKQASPKTNPEMTTGPHFLLFGNLPRDRAAAAMKGMDTAYAQLRAILSKGSASVPAALDWAEKPSLFVFNDAASFVEFVRSQESREIEPTVVGTANFGAGGPYVAVVDPRGGREEAAESSSGARKPPRSKRGNDESAGVERSVGGLLAEQMVAGVMRNEKNAPGWLCMGLGAYFGSAIDPKGPLTQKLRVAAAQEAQQGWTARANSGLAGRLKDDDTRVIGYAIVDWMSHDPRTRALFGPFVLELLAEGNDKLDQVLEQVFHGRRQDLLGYSEQWVVGHYGKAR